MGAIYKAKIGTKGKRQDYGCVKILNKEEPEQEGIFSKVVRAKKGTKEPRYQTVNAYAEHFFDITMDTFQTIGNSDNIVRLYGTEDGEYPLNQTRERPYEKLFKGTEMATQPYYVMELIKGSTLQDVLSEKGTLELPETILYISQICNALRILHDNNIIYQDIKPKNVMIRNGTAVLIDIDTARNIVDIEIASDIEDREQPGTYFYTAGYSLDDENICEQKDIFSLCVVFCECLIGIPQNSLKTSKKLAVLKKEIFKNDIPEELRKIIFKGLKEDPSERHKNIDEFVKELEACLALNYSVNFED
jgi:serine/threonine protein kinase